MPWRWTEPSGLPAGAVPSIKALALLDSLLHALVHLFVEEDGREAAQEGERQVHINVGETLADPFVRLLEHDTKRDSRVQGAQVLVGTRD